MKKNVIAEKDGYKIRFAQADDLHDYYAQNYCPLDREVVRLTGSKETFSEDEVRDFFLKSLKDPDRCFFLIVSPDDRIIGESVIDSIDEKSRSANFRIAIFRPLARNRGIGTWATEVTRDYAFEELKLRRLELDVYSFNPRAEQVYAKAGFKRERVIKNAITDGDRLADDILMAVSEEEWKKRKGLR